MRNIAEILEDDKNGKQLSQTERQIAVAYIQGKYDAVRELKIGNNNAMEVFDKLRAEIAEYGSIMVSYTITKDTKTDKGIEKLVSDVLKQAKKQVLNIIDKYRAESEG